MQKVLAFRSEYTLRGKLEDNRYQSLVLYFLMSIFRCKTFFKDNEMAIKIDNYNKHKQYYNISFNTKNPSSILFENL